MKRSRFTEEQIALALKQAELGTRVDEICRKMGTIEEQFPQRPIAAVPQALVVLGGGVSPPSGKSVDINLQSAADRVWYAARLFHAGKAPLLILSGGSDPAPCGPAQKGFG